MGKKRLEHIVCRNNSFYTLKGKRVYPKPVAAEPVVFIAKSAYIDEKGYYRPIMGQVRLQQGLINRSNAYTLTVAMYDDVISLSAQLYKI